ncbi:MAG: DUF4430 domain-containing protein, partial [Coriobacteriales bacterium]|jgi:hypothetical protein|nr:DUF4430 domain-containing protein [Coriobacteriales bacterium]
MVKQTGFMNKRMIAIVVALLVLALGASALAFAPMLFGYDLYLAAQTDATAVNGVSNGAIGGDATAGTKTGASLAVDGSDTNSTNKDAQKNSDGSISTTDKNSDPDGVSATNGGVLGVGSEAAANSGGSSASGGSSGSNGTSATGEASGAGGSTTGGSAAGGSTTGGSTTGNAANNGASDNNPSGAGGSGSAGNATTQVPPPEEQAASSQQKSITLTIDASVIGQGYIVAPRTVAFTQGETAFDVLRRECQTMGIHMEFSFNPMYNSSYIEGIGNLYEFDGGPNSGWLYSVNGWYPNYACSSYVLNNGDSVLFRYTLDRGADAGGVAQR